MSISYLRKLLKIFLKLIPVLDLIFSTFFASTLDFTPDSYTYASARNTQIVYEV